MLAKDDRVRATASVREVQAGDTGTVVAGWLRQNVTVRWDKDGVLRRLHRKRLEKIG